MSRLWGALAALVVFAVVGLWPTAAVAAPTGPIPPGLCTVEEWQNPLNWPSCSGKMQNALGQVATCTAAPTPGDPTSGFAGWVSARTDADLRPGITDRATKYGVGGYSLDIYGAGCASTLTHPASTGETELASGAFQLAAGVVGAADNLREHAYQPGGVWGFADGFLTSVVDKVYRYVFAPWGLIGCALVGVTLVWRSHRGDLSEAARMVAWAVFVMLAMTALFRWPLWSAHAADQVATSGISVAHTAVGQGPQDVPPDKCRAPNPEACQDHRTAAGRASAVLVDNVLYRNWLRAELGSADSATAKMYGPALYDAQTMTWDEADAAQDPKVRASIVADKAARWNTIAAQIRHDDPQAYEYLQGGHGMDRVFAGLAALLSAVLVCAFDLVASAVILFGFLLIRLVIMVAPLLATAGIFRPWSGPLRAAVDAFVSAIYHIVLFAALSGLYLSLAAVILGSSLPAFLQVLFVAAIGVGCWLLRRPLGRYRNLARLRPTRRQRRAEPEEPAGRRPAREVVPA